MRTKVLLAVAALSAAGLASSMAQGNVYSLNVVGYVNVVVEGGGSYNLLANPLNNTTENSLTNLFKAGTGPADGDQVLTWDVATFDFAAAQPLYGGGAWDQSVALPVGQGFFYVNNNSTFTNTFVGDVVQGSFTNFLTGGGSYNLIGSSAPVGGSFTNAIVGTTPADGDQILAWDVPTFDFQATQPLFGGGSWDSTAVNIKVAEGFFYVNNNADQNWVRNFTVQ
jgi:hypothetical protein